MMSISRLPQSLASLSRLPQSPAPVACLSRLPQGAASVCINNSMNSSPPTGMLASSLTSGPSWTSGTRRWREKQVEYFQKRGRRFGACHLLHQQCLISHGIGPNCRWACHADQHGARRFVYVL